MNYQVTLGEDGHLLYKGLKMVSPGLTTRAKLTAGTLRIATEPFTGSVECAVQVSQVGSVIGVKCRGIQFWKMPLQFESSLVDLFKSRLPEWVVVHIGMYPPSWAVSESGYWLATTRWDEGCKAWFIKDGFARERESGDLKELFAWQIEAAKKLRPPLGKGWFYYGRAPID